MITFERGNYAVVDDRHRYIRYNDGSEELYDRRADKAERTNLAGLPASKPVMAKLAKYPSR